MSQSETSRSSEPQVERAPAVAVPGSDENLGQVFTWMAAGRIILVGIAATSVWLRPRAPVAGINLIGLIGVIIGAWPIFKEAAENAAARRMTMELSMSIAIVAAAAIFQFFTALIITLFVLVAEVLENMTVSRGRRAIRNLLELLPRSVTIRTAEGARERSLEELRVGDAVLVNPGGLIAVDGSTISGHSFVDQSRITGESVPVEKMPGAMVYAGTLNQSGTLEIRVERLGRDTSYGRIIEAIERAEHARAPVQQIADRLAGYLVYFALIAAALTFIITRDARSTISVIIVAGACGIAAGTPLAILGAIGRSARLGAVIKGGLHLETLGRVNTVVLDKTGTLTFGRMEVQSIIPASGVSEVEVLQAAASAEMRSEHALGKAIVNLATARRVQLREPESFDYALGSGIISRIDGDLILVGNRRLLAQYGVRVPGDPGVEEACSSEVFVVRGRRFLGAIAIADTIRPEARQAIHALHRFGIRTILLTGDVEAIGKKIARDLGIAEVETALLPEAKLARIRDLMAAGRVVAMVGDGINDAPALAQAHVGVAIGSGTDVARESADVVLIGNDLLNFTDTLKIARWARRIIWWNFAGTIAVDIAGIALAAAGWLSPPLAALIHVTSELAFILNSARLLPRTNRDARTAEPPAALDRVPLAKAA